MPSRSRRPAPEASSEAAAHAPGRVQTTAIQLAGVILLMGGSLRAVLRDSGWMSFDLDGVFRPIGHLLIVILNLNHEGFSPRM
jgi:hypothetical protein